LSNIILLSKGCLGCPAGAESGLHEHFIYKSITYLIKH